MGVHAVVVCSRWGRVVHIGVGCTLGEGCARRGGVHAGGVCTSRGGARRGRAVHMAAGCTQRRVHAGRGSQGFRGFAPEQSGSLGSAALTSEASSRGRA